MNIIERIMRCIRELRHPRDTDDVVDEQRAKLESTLDQLKESAERERAAMDRVTSARKEAAGRSREVVDIVEDMLRRMKK